MRGMIAGALLLLAGCGGKTGLDQPDFHEMPVGMPASPAMPEGMATPPVAHVAAGLFHTCAVRDEGAVWCWGFNNAGQVGDGTVETRFAPVRVTGIDDAIFVRAGRAHTCALRRGGTIACWGWNLAGELGGATHEIRSATPLPLRSLGDVVDLAAGGRHTCALDSSGTVTCWGDDSHGQVGSTMHATHFSRFARVEIEPVSQLAAGWLHSCAVIADGGRVACWGDNTSGQLGAPPSELAGSPEPVEVLGVVDAVHVTAGDHHTCAVLAGGAVRCWGDNGHGQLGDGTRDPTNSAVTAVAIGDAVAVAAGHEHTCALRRTGEVACWGRADRGQLGIVTDDPFRVVPSMGHGLSDVVELTVGWRHGCALRSTGEALCWGRNAEGQLGTDSTAMRQTPTLVAW